MLSSLSLDTLAAWAKEIVEKKISTVNMLGCHDGIPLLDLKGLLPKEEIDVYKRQNIGSFTFPANDEESDNVLNSGIDGGK